MANPSKQKGTGGETELVNDWNESMDGFEQAKRTSPGMLYDIVVPGWETGQVDLLATRPDMGRWLVTMRWEDFKDLYAELSFSPELHIEVKRYKRFALHAIWNKKFGGKA